MRATLEGQGARDLGPGPERGGGVDRPSRPPPPSTRLLTWEASDHLPWPPGDAPGGRSAGVPGLPEPQLQDGGPASHLELFQGCKELLPPESGCCGCSALLRSGWGALWGLGQGPLQDQGGADQGGSSSLRALTAKTHIASPSGTRSHTCPWAVASSHTWVQTPGLRGGSVGRVTSVIGTPWTHTLPCSCLARRLHSNI